MLKTSSKIFIFLFITAVIILGIWAFFVFKDRDGKVVINNQPQQNTATDSTVVSSNDDQNVSNENNAINTSDPICAEGASCNSDISFPADKNAGKSADPSASAQNDNPIKPYEEVKGQMLARITPEHCENNCQAFAIDLALREYCEQACGISPVKIVSNCDNTKDIQKDYCFKDLAVVKSDSSACDKIKDANIKQACKSRIQQDIIENYTY